MPVAFARSLGVLGTSPRTLTVVLSNELVELLSSQMYQSPLKAIEELVVNSYDADAGACRVFVPFGASDARWIAVYDDGTGMDYEGLVNLWHIGRSSKKGDASESGSLAPEASGELLLRAGRKRIGKFGIGKLATYTLARYVTYLTRSEEGLLAVSLDFEQFAPSEEGPHQPVILRVDRLANPAALASGDSFRRVCETVGVAPEALIAPEARHWTICVLEGLKPKADEIRAGRLRWVLSTAMPLRAGFTLFLNGQQIESSKVTKKPLVEFSIAELPPKRMRALAKPDDGIPGVDWRVSADHLVSDLFPSGVSGSVIVTADSLYGGKSDDLARSNGFFMRVRGRLVNERDELVGLHPLSYETYNRFRADIDADDLNASIVAAREGLSETIALKEFRRLMSAAFSEARERYDRKQKEREEEELRKKEHERNYVTPRLVELPIADVLATGGIEGTGAEADKTWFYMQLPRNVDVQTLVKELYEGRRAKYKFVYSHLGRTARMAVFDPRTAEFLLNADHEFIREYSSDARAAELLEDVVAAEALLEVYLREYNVPPQVAGKILERRDSLFRSFARDHANSPPALASALRESSASERDLEMALVAAARALGFVASHIGGQGQPDGLATFNDHSGGAKTITLEAKSSKQTPQLSALDLAGVQEHMGKYNAAGCLLIAPRYPGETKSDDSAVATRASAAKISCWTIEDLARVVEAIETRHINAHDVLDIVTTAFAPDKVRFAVGKLLSDPAWDMRDLYRAIAVALRALEARLPDVPRNVDLIAAEVSRDPAFTDIRRSEVLTGIRDLAAASQGSITLTGNDTLLLHVTYDELDRRVNRLTGESGVTRRPSTFRDSGNDS